MPSVMRFIVFFYATEVFKYILWLLRLLDTSQIFFLFFCPMNQYRVLGQSPAVSQEMAFWKALKLVMFQAGQLWISHEAQRASDGTDGGPQAASSSTCSPFPMCHTSLCKKDRRTQVLCKTEEWSLLQNFRMITSKTETQSSGEEQGSQCPHQLDRWLGGNDRKDVSLTLPIRPRYPAD